MILAQSFNGAWGYTHSCHFEFLRLPDAPVPLVSLLAVIMKIEPDGVFGAIVISEIALAFVTAFIFRRSRWEMVKI
jgi:Na+-driven multidrug efflux pump